MLLELSEDRDGRCPGASQGLRPALIVRAEDVRPLRILALKLGDRIRPRIAGVALQVPIVVDDISQDGLHLGLAAGHDLPEQVAGIPIHEDPAQIEDDGIHRQNANGSWPSTLRHMRQVYLAATGRNHGKTTFALGLLAAMIDQGLATAFMKPVGQRYAHVDGIPADEDAILMRDHFGLTEALTDMSPVHLPRGFTKSFIRGEVVEDLAARIDAAHQRLTQGHEALLIEGSGHAGVGAVVGLSNADVAARMRAPAVIVSEGGVGRPIDEIVLNRALFARHGVPLLGAIINKVDIGADPTLPEVLERGLARHGIPLLGVLPYRPMLAHPTVTMLFEQMKGELLSPGGDMDRLIEHVAIGAGQARDVLSRIGPGSLLIVQGDRQDIIHATIAASKTQEQLDREPGLLERFRNRSRFGREPQDPLARLLAGMVFTRGRRPGERDIDALREAGIFAYFVDDEIYPVASAIHGLLVKTHLADKAKIDVIKQVVAENFDVASLLDRLDATPWPTTTTVAPASEATIPQISRQVDGPVAAIQRRVRGLAGRWR